MSTAAIILQFLIEHSGKEFCTGCLSRRLFDGREIDVAMRHLEGQGGIRHHGRCSDCDRARLVAGWLSDSDRGEHSWW
jgi:hypothetical protein